jgi:hypothetical protein
MCGDVRSSPLYTGPIDELEKMSRTINYGAGDNAASQRVSTLGSPASIASPRKTRSRISDRVVPLDTAALADCGRHGFDCRLRSRRLGGSALLDGGVELRLAQQ